jgi:hypothetical protein
MGKGRDITERPGAQKPAVSARGEIEAFLKEAGRIAPTGAARGRLVFALDSTMRRQPTADLAC